MRRLWAFICMVFSLAIMIVFNVQSIYESNNLSLEYTNSKEVVIQVEKRDDGINLSEKDISSKVADRLDTAGANNSQVEISLNSSDRTTGEIRVKLSTNTDAEYENIVRILTSNTNLTFANANDDYITGSDIIGDSDDVMELEYSGVTPMPKFVVGNIEKYNELVAKNDSITDEDLKKNIYVWANKTDEDTYDRAFGNEDEGIEAVPEVRAKIIATLSTDNYSKEDDDDYGYISLSTDENGDNFTIASARSYVNARNCDDYGFNVTKLYDNTIDPILPTNSRVTLLIGYGVGLLVLVIGLILAYSLNGLLAGLSIAVSTMFTFMVSNFVGFIFTPVTALAVLFVIGLAIFITVYTLNRMSDEFKKGRSIQKSHYEAFRKGGKINLIICGLSFFVSLFSFFVGKGIVKVFFGYIIIGSILDMFVSFYLTKWQSYWLATSILGTNHPKLLGLTIKENKIVNKIENYDVVNVDKKKQRKIISISTFAVTCAIVLATFLTFGLMKGDTKLFNNTFDYTDGYRINISYITEREVTDEETFTDFNDVADNLNSATELKDIFSTDAYVSSYTFNRVETYDIDDKKETYTFYISMELSSKLDDNQIATLQSYVEGGFNNKLKLYSSSSVTFNSNSTTAGSVTHNNMFFYMVGGLIVVFMFGLYLLYYGLYAALQVLLTLSVEYGLSMAFIVLACLPFNSFTQFGLYIGLFVTGICFVPIYQRYRELKKDTKSKHAPLQEQVKLYNLAFKESIIPIGLINGILLITGIISLFVSSNTMLGCGILMIFMSVVSFAYTIFISGYDYVFFREHIKLKPIKIKIKHKKKEEIVSKNEPNEAIVPGVNEFLF